MSGHATQFFNSSVVILDWKHTNYEEFKYKKRFLGFLTQTHWDNMNALLLTDEGFQNIRGPSNQVGFKFGTIHYWDGNKYIDTNITGGVTSLTYSNSVGTNNLNQADSSTDYTTDAVDADNKDETDPKWLLAKRLDWSKSEGITRYSMSSAWTNSDFVLKEVTIQFSKDEHHIQGVYIDFSDILADDEAIFYADGNTPSNHLYIPCDPHELLQSKAFDINLGRIAANSFNWGISGVKYFPAFGMREYGIHTGARMMDRKNQAAASDLTLGFWFEDYGEPLHVQCVVEVRAT